MINESLLFKCIENDSVSTHITEFLDYFERTWLGRMTRGKMRPPTFPIELWNIHELVLAKLPRTNNAIEGWHNKMVHFIGGKNPNIWNFLDKLKNSQSNTESIINDIMVGVPPRQKKKNYRDMDKKLYHLVNNYADFGENLTEFVQYIAENIYF